MSDAEPLRILASNATASRIHHSLTRRGFLAALGAFGTATALTACAQGSSRPTSTGVNGEQLEDALTIYTWGDYDSPDVIEAFTADLGPVLTVDAFGSNEEMISKLVGARGTSGYDIVVPTGLYIKPMAEHGLLDPIDHSLVPNISRVSPEFLDQGFDPGNQYSICKTWGTTGFVYDTKVIQRELTTWDDFFDAAQNEASGKTSMLDDPAGILGCWFWSKAIDVNTATPEQLAEAEDYLVNTLAPHVSAFDSYPGSTGIPQGTGALFQAWNTDARMGIMSAPDPDRWKWSGGGPESELWMDNWAIAAGAPHPNAAHAFLNFVLEPDNAFQQMDYVGGDTGAIGLRERAEEEGVEYLDLIFYTPEQVAKLRTVELTEHQQRFVDIWNKVKARAGQ